MKKIPRLLSVDYFRGLAVLLMLLYDYVPFFSRTVPLFLQHGRPDILLFGDFIAPFFLFIMGFSLALSIEKRRAEGLSETVIFWQVVRRAVLLLLIGVLIDDLRSPMIGGTIGLGGTYYIRWGVLETLGVSYLVSYLVMRFPVKWRFVVIGGLLATYMALVTNAWFASFVLSHAHGSPLAAISWATIAAFGLVAGDRWVNNRRDFEIYLYRLGGTLILIGTVVSIFMPARKDLVTSSYALITAGGAAIAFMLMYYFVETRPVTRLIKWLRPILEFGRAALLAWLLQYALSAYLIWYFHTHGGLDPWLGIPLALVMIAVVWLVVRQMNRKGFRLAV
jgi:predicted acyltransferase